MDTRLFVVDEGCSMEEALAAETADGWQPRLALVFASVDQNIAATAALLEGAGLDVFCVSSASEIALDSAGGDAVREGAAVVLLLAPPEGSWEVRLFEGEDRASFSRGGEVGRWAMDRFRQGALLLATSGLRVDGQKIAEGIDAATGGEVPVFGGMAGDDLRVEQTWVAGGGAASDDGTLALLFDRTQLAVDGVFASGWKGVGLPKTVTRSLDNQVYEIDGRPAMELYREYLNISSHEELQLSAEHPLEVTSPDGRVFLRAPLVYDADVDVIYFAGTVPEGSQVRFANAPGPQIVDRARESVDRLRREAPRADALVLFSCKARHLACNRSGPLLSS